MTLYVDGFQKLVQEKFVLAVPVAASGFIQGSVGKLTFTADAVGVGGNSISVTFTTGATAGAEVVSVVGSAISVQIEDGVSTAAQIKAAVDATPAAAALVNTVATTAGAMEAGTVTLASGSDGTPSGLTRNGVGSFTFTLSDRHSSIAGFMAGVHSHNTTVSNVAKVEILNIDGSETASSINIALVDYAGSKVDVTAASTLLLGMFISSRE